MAEGRERKRKGKAGLNRTVGSRDVDWLIKGEKKKKKTLLINKT